MMPASLGGLATADLALVVDSWPVMEWLKGRQPVAGHFRGMLDEARRVELIMSSINLGEVFYNCWNWWSEARAEEILIQFSELPIRVVHPSAEDTLLAARIKGRYKISYADAFAAVLAIRYSIAVLTGDPDFLKLERQGTLAVEWMNV